MELIFSNFAVSLSVHISVAASANVLFCAKRLHKNIASTESTLIFRTFDSFCLS